MNNPVKTVGAGGLSQALLVIFLAWCTRLHWTVSPEEAGAYVLLLNGAIQDLVLGQHVSLDDIKKSLMADATAAASTITGAAKTSIILFGLGLSALGLCACISTQLEQANTDLQTIVAKVNMNIQTVSKDLPTVCAFVDDLNAGFGLVAQISTTVAGQSADEQLAYASAHAICTGPAPQDVPGAILAVASAGLKIQAILKPAISSASQ